MDIKKVSLAKIWVSRGQCYKMKVALYRGQTIQDLAGSWMILVFMLRKMGSHWKVLSSGVTNADWHCGKIFLLLCGKGLEWSWGNQVITVVQVRGAGSSDSRGNSGDGKCQCQEILKRDDPWRWFGYKQPSVKDDIYFFDLFRALRL